jgi:riboflavin kinase/FMN adenylyltransferase
MIEPFTITGTVIHGNKKGRTVGMPTANLKVPPGLDMPKNGVYAAIVLIKEDYYYGVTHIGRRPSVDQSPEISVETHILDFEADIYDQTIIISLRLFIRPTLKFNSLNAVKSQVAADCLLVREYFELL